MSNKNIIMLMYLAMIAWGLTWTNAKVLGEYLNPYELVFWRFSLSAVGLLPVIFSLGLNLKITFNNLLLSCLAGLLLIAYNYCFFSGTNLGSAGLGGVLVTTLIPVISFIFIAILNKKKFKAVETMALVLGAVGTGITMELWQYNLNESPAYFRFLLLAACIWPLITILSSKIKKVSPLTFSFYMFIFASLFDYIFALEFVLTDITVFDLRFWTHLLLLSLCGTTFGTSVYFIGTRQLGSKQASIYFFLVPLSALVCSSVVINEAIGITTLVGGTMSLISVYMINGFKIGSFKKKPSNKVKIL